jgi:hypothetical protein
MTHLLLESEIGLPSILTWLVKPAVYIGAFAIYGIVSKARARFTTAVAAGLLRAALGYALGAVAVLLVTILPTPALHAVLAACRFGSWFGLARLFFPRGRGAGAFGVVALALNLALDFTLLGGAMVSPA